MESRLAPCPFCGGTEIINDYAPVTFGESLIHYRVRCKTCGASFWHPETTEDDEGRPSWNTRPLEDAKDATIERMRGLLGETLQPLWNFAATEQLNGSKRKADRYLDLRARIEAELEGGGDD